MDSGFDLFDHTADVGVRAFAPTLPGLLQPAAEGLYAVIGELVPGGDSKPEQFTSASGDLAILVHDFLSELLVMFEQDQRIITALTVDTFEPGRLNATGESQILDPEKSLYDREVKAITYHGLRITPIEGGHELRYIVDI